MQFVMFIYQGTTPTPYEPERWNALSSDEQQGIYAAYGALNQTTGVTPGLGLTPPAQATTVRVSDGETVTTPGQYATGDGGVSGYLVFEAEDMDDAVSVAATIPAARYGGAIEIRQVASW